MDKGHGRVRLARLDGRLECDLSSCPPTHYGMKRRSVSRKEPSSHPSPRLPTSKPAASRVGTSAGECTLARESPLDADQNLMPAPTTTRALEPARESKQQLCIISSFQLSREAVCSDIAVDLTAIPHFTLPPPPPPPSQHPRPPCCQQSLASPLLRAFTLGKSSAQIKIDQLRPLPSNRYYRYFRSRQRSPNA